MNLKTLLQNVLSQPTAPFRETWVKNAIQGYASRKKIPIYEDPTGNLWLNAKSKTHAQAASLVFVAHLDHPGMVITKFYQKNKRVFAQGQWLGGGPMDIRNFDVRVFSDFNGLTYFNGKIISHTVGARGPKKVEIEIEPTTFAKAACNSTGLKELGPWGACLWYAKSGVPLGMVEKKGLLVTKAADDLVGVCAILDALSTTSKKSGVVGLLTRAEESGFHGTLEVLEKNYLDPKKTLVISVETSSQLVGAEIGKGPVVRLGDRATIFNPGFVYWIQERAAELQKKDSQFSFQRRIMDGGTCEATAFNMFGFKVAGLSTPLHNYHNISKSGKPEPEAVSIQDVKNLTKLIAQIIKSHRKSDIASIEIKAFATYLQKLRENQKAHQKYFSERGF